MDIRTLIRTIPDYPRPGVQFRDITTLLKDPQGLKRTVDGFLDRYRGWRIDKVAGIEARGFLIGAPLAYELGVGFVPIRKQGKLPAEKAGYDYELEYGGDRVEVHLDAIAPGESVLLVDDLIATGGTAMAAIRLIETLGGKVAECAFVIDLVDLKGRPKLESAGYGTFALCGFEGN
ncbi:MAG TPA: adenine phosphoribosyltransferase [Methylophilaceae bacterium]